MSYKPKSRRVHVEFEKSNTKAISIERLNNLRDQEIQKIETLIKNHEELVHLLSNQEEA